MASLLGELFKSGGSALSQYALMNHRDALQREREDRAAARDDANYQRRRADQLKDREADYQRGRADRIADQKQWEKRFDRQTAAAEKQAATQANHQLTRDERAARLRQAAYESKRAHEVEDQKTGQEQWEKRFDMQTAAAEKQAATQADYQREREDRAAARDDANYQRGRADQLTDQRTDQRRWEKRFGMQTAAAEKQAATQANHQVFMSEQAAAHEEAAYQRERADHLTDRNSEREWQKEQLTLRMEAQRREAAERAKLQQAREQQIAAREEAAYQRERADKLTDQRSEREWQDRRLRVQMEAKRREAADRAGGRLAKESAETLESRMADLNQEMALRLEQSKNDLSMLDPGAQQEMFDRTTNIYNMRKFHLLSRSNPADVDRSQFAVFFRGMADMLQGLYREGKTIDPSTGVIVPIDPSTANAGTGNTQSLGLLDSFR